MGEALLARIEAIDPTRPERDPQPPLLVLVERTDEAPPIPFLSSGW
ncbi:MAG: hypothetical protein IPK72_02105 [Candidatus Eisenbacteria bacterium]|nr:hypothetical protein [Candidatus Eisenbacteria bacterium]